MSELSEWRARMGWTQEQAAKALGLSRRGYQNYEHGRTERGARATPKTVMMLAEMLEGRSS